MPGSFLQRLSVVFGAGRVPGASAVAGSGHSPRAHDFASCALAATALAATTLAASTLAPSALAANAVASSDALETAAAPPATFAVAPASLPRIVDDARLALAVERARTRFLSRHTFDRFDVTVLAARPDGTWARGAHGGGELAYPASCVKLAYLVGAVRWCAAQARAPECLDADVRPMIVESDNVATGRVVDAISGVRNVDSPPPAFEDWLARRRYTERLLEAYGLHGGMRLLNKTYPTNSSEDPAGFEKLVIDRIGRNAMAPDASARLLLAIVSGAIEPQARDYSLALLARERFGGHGTFGRGLPPGTEYVAKTGNAYDTQEEIAWFRLPDGREFVIAAFSNSWDQSQPLPHDVGHFGDFVEDLLAELPRGRALPGRPGLPWSARIPARAARVDGAWEAVRLRGTYDAAQPAHIARASDAALEWRVRVPSDGAYELAVWYPAQPEATAAAEYEIANADGTRTVVRYDQRVWSSRWLPLGRYASAGREIVVRLRGAAPGVLVADAIRVTAADAATLR